VSLHNLPERRLVAVDKVLRQQLFVSRFVAGDRHSPWLWSASVSAPTDLIETRWLRGLRLILVRRTIFWEIGLISAS
jgi:hypothetical protein